MDGSDSSRSRTKKSLESTVDTRDGRVEDTDNWEADDKRRHRSSKSRKNSNAEEAEEHDSGRRKTSGDKNNERKRSGSLSRAGSGEEDNYDVRRESSSKAPRKDPEERGEKRSSDGYQDREVDGSRKSRDEESERNSSRRASTKPSDHESSQIKSRSKVESPHEESRYPESKVTSREKGHGQHEQESYSQPRRWDDTDTDRKDQESGYVDRYDSRSSKASDHDKHGPSRDRKLESRYELGEAKGRAVGSSSEKDVRSASREDRRVDEERSKSRGRSVAQGEDSRPVTVPPETRSDADRDDKQRKARERSAGLVEDVEHSDRRFSTKPYSEKGEKHRQQLDSARGGRDEVRSRERSDNMDEDGHARMRDRNGKEVGRNRRSRSPERSGRHHRDLDDRDRGFSESDNEKSFGFKNKEREEGYRDDRSSKGKDNWIDRNRESEGSKDHWKRSQTRQDDKDGDAQFDHVREWDSMRREQERVDSEKYHSRPGYRKDTRIRSEGGKTSSQNVNSDRIEIVPNKSLDFGRQESFATFSGRRVGVESQQDFASGMNDEEWGHPPEEKDKMAYLYGYELQERYKDDDSTMESSRRNSLDSQRVGLKGPMDFNRAGPGQSPSGGSQPSFGNNQGSGSFNRGLQQGPKGARPGRGGRGGRLTGREAQRIGVPLPMMGSPFGHLGLSPGPMQPITPNMPHSSVPSIGPGVLLPPFPGPLGWPGARGVDMNMLAVPPSLPPIPPGPTGARFAPNMGSGPNHGMYFPQPGHGRGVPSSISSPGFNATGTNGRATPHDKAPIGWGPPKNSGPSGKAPSRGEQNDYSQNFVDTGMRPQNFIRELELTSVVEDYPKLRELIQKKDEIVANSASPPMYYKCDLREHVLSPEFFATKFDVILVDPPWEEYVHRAPGVTDHMEYWTFEEIQNLKIEAIADTPSFIFLWVGDGAGLEQGRQCLKKWGFRRCEDICWVKTNKTNATPGLRHDSHTLFQHSKEHCLMGIKGTVRRSIDGHIIHANIDTDVIIAEEPAYGTTKKPEDMYRIIEHFSLGRRRLELFGEDHNIRSGWLTVGKELSSSNFNSEAYIRNFGDKDGKVWQGGGGRNPPPDAPHLVVTTLDIESLRPKSPPPKNQQQPIPLMSSSSSNNRRPTGNSLQNPMASPLSGLNLDASGSDPSTPVPWAASPMRGLGDPEGGHGGSDDKFFDGYGFNVCAQASGDNAEFEPHQAVNML